MKLEWTEYKESNLPEAPVGEAAEHAVYLAQLHTSDDKDVKQAIEICVEKAVALLAKNINEQSRYMLFEWDEVNCTLAIVVTDDKKTVDSPSVVKCHFAALAAKMRLQCGDSAEAWERQRACYTTLVKDWIRDFLTTCAGFMNYSLVALFHADVRGSAELL